MMNEKKIRRAKMFNYLCFGAVVFGVCLLFGILIFYNYRHSFTEKKWKEDIENRALIVGDMLEEHDLIGMTAEDVEKLLGGNNNDFGYFNKKDRYVYYLGSVRTIIDSEWLLIDFEDNVVIDYEIKTD